MSVQISQNNQNAPFILNEDSIYKTGTIAQDLARTVDLLPYTVMAYNATTQRWTPLVALNLTNGESMPRGIYLGDLIEAADLVDGEIEDAPILIKNGLVNREMVVFDQDILNADSIVNPATINATSVEFALSETASITLEDTDAISEAGL